MSAKRDAIGRRSVDPIGFEATGERRAPITERPGGGDSVAHRGLLDVGSDDADLAETGSDLREAGDAGTVDTVVVGNEDAQLHTY